MPRLPLSLPFLLWLGCLSLPEAHAGEIEGQVTLRTSSAPGARGTRQKSRPRAYDGAAPASQLDDETTGLVVFLEQLTGGPQRPGVYSLEQKGRRFIPHVLPIVQGSTVNFVNADKVYHSVYSEAECRAFDFPEYPPGVSRKVSFPQCGVVELFCAIHQEMNGYVLVLPNGHFCKVDSQHRYRLRAVPGGTHLLKTWHPRLPAQSRRVEVPAQGSVHLDLEL